LGRHLARGNAAGAQQIVTVLAERVEIPAPDGSVMGA